MSPELCLGLFIEKDGHDELIGHVIATRITLDRVTDGSMEMPQDWDGSRRVVKADDGLVIGNDANGSGIGVHGLVIVAEHQKKGLGRLLLNKYIEYLRNLDQKAECVAIIAHDHLLQFYDSVGFMNLGPSPCNFGGGGWYDMVSVTLTLQQSRMRLEADIAGSETVSHIQAMVEYKIPTLDIPFSFIAYRLSIASQSSRNPCSPTRHW